MRARRAEGYTPRDVAEGIRGAKRGAFVDERGKRHDDLTLICQSGSKLEDFIGRAGLRVIAGGADPAEVERRQQQTQERRLKEARE